MQTNKKFKLVSNKKTRTILPNMFTLVGVCIGLTSIKFAFDERFGLAIICIIVAGLIDGLDGRIARLIKGTSQVGKELDSLTDVISFGEEIVVVQIAGLVARRIVTETTKGEKLEQGARIGMIRFGSRAELYFENFKPLVKVDQKTVAGETLIAKR